MSLSALGSDRLQAVLEAQTRIASAQMDPESVMSAAAVEAMRLTGGVGASLDVIEGDGLIRRGASGTQLALMGSRSRIDDPENAALESDGVVLAEDEASMRLRSPEGTLGVVRVMAGRGKTFTAEDAAALEVVSVLIATCLSHALQFAAKAKETRMDPVTELPTGPALGERLESELARARRMKEPLSLVLLEIDDYGKLRERGREDAERALKTVAGELKKGRASDVKFRLDGGGFAVLMPGTDEEGAEIAAIRLAWSIATAHPGGDPLTVSTGVAQPETGDVYSLMTAAQIALSETKETLVRH
jgi:diguanylate cyclase (GGDEF)-like protein